RSALNGLDAIIFTAGVGENSALVRKAVCSGLDGLGIKIDAEKNATGRFTSFTQLQTADSKVRILVIPTNEEVEILHEATELLSGTL
ncbi:acetate kinase, partial [Arthrospira platensis SPKY1]|nr:acetate kinase [Arthrospira platensis SPKY1]